MIEDKLKYKRTMVVSDLVIDAGQFDSNVFDCGGMQIRALLFPGNWTGCDVTFFCSYDGQSNSLYALKSFDGLSLSSFEIPGVSSNFAIPLVPYLFDCFPYIKISCSATQVNNVVVKMLLQPIYQGIHA